MHDTHDMDDLDEEFSGPSKSAVKRQMTALQELGESLTRLSKKQLANVPIDDERLIEAVLETQRISSKNARKRHMQFIGKLMREALTDSEKNHTVTQHHSRSVVARMPRVAGWSVYENILKC